jgi:hypothetical protein
MSCNISYNGWKRACWQSVRDCQHQLRHLHSAARGQDLKREGRSRKKKDGGHCKRHSRGERRLTRSGVRRDEQASQTSHTVQEEVLRALQLRVTDFSQARIAVEELAHVRNQEERYCTPRSIRRLSHMLCVSRALPPGRVLGS